MSHTLIVEEKVDGANFGISFDRAGNIQLQNRGSYLIEPYLGQWKKISVWLQGKLEQLFDALEDDLILFGEWCYAKHSISYNNLPDWFLGFDIFEKNGSQFWSVEKRNILLKKVGIPPVPKLAEGKFNLIELEQFLSRSLLSAEPAEGLYLRVENNNRLVDRAKLVRPAFIQAVTEHWSKKQIQANILRRNNE